MIDYGVFQFAAPPLTAVQWFLHACRAAGLGEGFVHHAVSTFSGDDPKLRVSLVRNPCDWLISCYLAACNNKLRSNHVGVFNNIPTRSLDGFIGGYLDRCPGAVGKLFDQYCANTCIRVEDMPYAAYELFESVGHRKLICAAPHISGWSNANILPSKLRSRIINAEQSLAERYDYW